MEVSQPSSQHLPQEESPEPASVYVGYVHVSVYKCECVCAEKGFLWIQ